MSILSQNQMDYILLHLANHWEGDDRIASAFQFVANTSLNFDSFKGAILFPLSDTLAPEPVHIKILGNCIPVLFPIAPTDAEAFVMDNRGNLVFRHDFLKSAFYLLSGQQETETKERDFIGRYPYDQSIQKELNCVQVPVVNYYFELIVQGLEAYCRFHQLEIKRKKLFSNFGFLLSHDVDRIAFYHPREVIFKIKQIIGLAPMYYSRALTFKLFLKGVFRLMNFQKQQDPWWNFNRMIDIEKQLGIRSSFYFLKKEHRNMDSRYTFKTEKIIQLIQQLLNEGFEVGLHGTLNSSENFDSMQQQVTELSDVTGSFPVGIRQHYLRFIHPHTFRLQQKAGLQYDTSLGFAEHDGYRNGYCYPFRPYDIENDEMLKIWEIPLIMMDVSVLNYRSAGFEELKASAFSLIEEAKLFGGLFSLLWHNCRLDEYQYPGVNRFYDNLLRDIACNKPDILTGQDLIEKICQ